MKALVLPSNLLDAHDAVRSLQVTTRPIPRPRRGQVRIQIEAAACNPSDILTLQGLYGVKKRLPTIPGWEGCGTVVESGGGFVANRLLGKRVACGLQADGDGTWAEFFVTDALSCVPLKAGVPIEQAAGLIVNPFSAVGLLDTVRSCGYKNFVHTAGLSQVGRMLLALEKHHSLTGIHLVRRTAQIPEMRALGAKFVLSLESPQWQEELTTLCREHNVRAGIDAVGGEVTGKLMAALPTQSTVWVYGALSLQPCSAINPLDLIFQNKQVKGFYLGTWFGQKNLFQMLRAGNQVQNLVRQGVFATQVRTQVGLDQAPQELLRYLDNMSAGKVLICPGK